MRVASTPQSATRRLQPFHHVDLRDIAANVRCPTLVFHARHDARIPFEEGRALAAHIPSARFVALDSRNHWVVETEPAWAQFAAEIDGFLPGVSNPHVTSGVLDALTPRELQVVELLAAGLDNATIGRQLGISAKTVRNRVSIIFDKLGVNSRPQAIVLARDAGCGRKPPVE
jgi:DNA-binding CsgD family transcriptional regulator